jgi:hypothetical protein
MRFILDSHPDLACGPETNIASTAATLVLNWGTLEGAESSSRPGTAPLPPEAGRAVRDTIDQMFDRYLRRRGKKRWADKSLSTPSFAGLMARLYPDAQFICLFRHCMDVIASGVEATPWGLRGFGFSEYVMKHPGNDVAAIGNYWLDTAQNSLAFMEEHPQACHRVRYEDLVTDPEGTIAGIFGFLGMDQVPGIADLVFKTAHEGGGPSDPKIWFTRAITSGSMGRGVTVPADMLPPGLRGQINETLAKLEYRPVDEKWNEATAPTDPRVRPPSADLAASGAGPEQQAAKQALAARLESCDDNRRAVSAQWPELAGTKVTLIVQSADGPSDELRLTLGPRDGAAPAGGSGADRGREAVIVADPATWLGLLEGRVNLATELKASRLRYTDPDRKGLLRSAALHAATTLLGIATIPTLHTRTQPEEAPAGTAG